MKSIIKEDDMQNRKLKRWSKTSFRDPIKKCVTLTAKIITAAHKSKGIKFKLDKDTLHHWVYFLYFMNPLKIVSLQVEENYILLMEYQYMREEDLLDYNKMSYGTFCMHTYMQIVKY